MKNARSWFFHRFLLGMGAFLGLQALLIGLGVPWLLRLHEEEQTRILTAEALEIILDHTHQPSQEILSSGPFLVYGAQGELIFSNRGMGRGLPADSRAPVLWEGRAVGWVYTGDTAFLNQEANLRFLVTLGQLFLISLAGSMAVALIWAAHHGKKIAQIFWELRGDMAQIALRQEALSRRAPFEELEDIFRELQRLGRTLSRSEQKQKAFLQDVTHDLRTPLTGLRSQLEGMADGVLPADRDRLSGLLSETDRIEALITDLSFLFRTEGSQQLKKVEVSLPGLVDTLRFRFEGILNTRHIRWDVEFQVQNIATDRQLFERALGNLVENSLHHAKGVTRISLGSEASEMGILIWVQDDGPGVPEALLTRIFQRHYRGDPGRSSKGSGLGLSILQAIVEKHGGKVWAENVAPRGLRVTLLLPS